MGSRSRSQVAIVIPSAGQGSRRTRVSISGAGQCLLLLIALGIQATGWATDTKALQKVDSPDMRAAVQLQVQEGIDVGGGKPGFKLTLCGWPPGASFNVYALDPVGTHVSLVDGARTDQDGAATVAVPYEAEGLYPGYWIIGVTSKNLTRGERLLVPRVIHGRHGWRLDFKSSNQSQSSQNPP